MNLEDRDYKFTDEQVRALGFSSYEELEKYYDIVCGMIPKERPLTKQELDSIIEGECKEDRLALSRRDRLKEAIKDHVEVLLGWDSKSWIPTSEEIVGERMAINMALDIYCKFANKQSIIDQMESELSASKFGKR